MLLAIFRGEPCIPDPPWVLEAGDLDRSMAGDCFHAGEYGGEGCIVVGVGARAGNRRLL